MSSFAEGEVVIVAALRESWSADDQWVLGEEGIVFDGDNPRDVSVWIRERDRPGERSLWGFDAGELKSTGVVDVELARRIHREEAARGTPPDSWFRQPEAWTHHRART